jgi:RimJ/RimL family protein N-acetyltransferase
VPLSLSTPLRTSRLVLRAPQAADADAFAALCADPEVMRYVGRGAALSRAEGATAFAALLAPWRDGGEGLRTALDAESGEYLGLVGVALGTGGAVAGRPEIGWRLRRAAWGRGLATEGAAAIRDHAFATRGHDRLYAICRPAHRASARVMEKIGMRLVRRDRDGRGAEVLLYVGERPA